jgi:hypothetical protein
MLVTAQFPLTCHAWNRALLLMKLSMMKKSIAAALLVVMVVWAEMALAPMFIMQVWHVNPGREMSDRMAAHHHAMPPGHPCCPGISKAEQVAAPEFAATSPPCQDEHRCCFRQGPLSVPAPVSARNRVSRDAAPAQIAELSLAHDTGSYLFSSTVILLSPPPSLLGMILRV